MDNHNIIIYDYQSVVHKINYEGHCKVQGFNYQTTTELTI